MKEIVVLDSSIINQDRSCSSVHMKLFVKWASLKLISWHIPWIVYKEVVSKGLIDGKDSFDKACSAIKDVQRLGLASDFMNDLTKLLNRQNNLKTEFQEKNEAFWIDFFQKNNAVIDEFDCTQSFDVFEAYFAGDPPFSSPKFRKDIPDAFIYQSLVKLKNIYHVIFICDDENLRKKSGKIENVTCYKSLIDFINSESGCAIHEQYKFIEKYGTENQYVQTYEQKIIEHAKADVCGELLECLEGGFNNSAIPSDDAEGSLECISEIKTIKIKDSEIALVDDKICIPILVECRFEIEYFLFKQDYPLYEDRQISILDNDWNRHYYLVSESFDASFSFTYTLKKTSDEFEDSDLKVPLKIDELHLEPVYKQKKC